MAKLRHIAIMCDDLAAATSFWKTTFELTEVGTAGDGKHVGVTYLSDGTINVSLVSFAGDGRPPQGLNHLGFVVDDLTATVDTALASGAISLMSESDLQAARLGAASFEAKLQSPEGVSFDLSQSGWPT